jgi:hypothetical protein
VFSIVYLFALFATLPIDHGNDSFSPAQSSPGGRGAPVHDGLKSGAARSAHSSINLGTSEV